MNAGSCTITVPFDRFVVWYSDEMREEGVTTDDWRACRSDGVVLVQLLYHKAHKGKHVQQVLAGHDYYWRHHGHFHAGNATRMPDNVNEKDLKSGKFVADDVYHRMYNAACEGVHVAQS